MIEYPAKNCIAAISPIDIANDELKIKDEKTYKDTFSKNKALIIK